LNSGFVSTKLRRTRGTNRCSPIFISGGAEGNQHGRLNSGGVLQPTDILGYIAAMSCPEDIAPLSRQDLLTLVAELQRQVMALQEQVAQLTANNQSLVAENEQLKRSVKRQAAPFSKGTQVKQPKRPGRKPGQGTFSFRQAPCPEEITEVPVNVPVTQESCLACGG
jgi:hypothetical protein